jgi:hypothetical protein
LNALCPSKSNLDCSHLISKDGDNVAQRRLIPMPGRLEAQTALAYAQIAVGDHASSRLLYSQGQYPQAVYLLQQSVEKSTKAFALMIGTVKLKHLRMVSHYSVYALLQRVGWLSDYLGQSISSLLAPGSEGNESLVQIGLLPIVETVAKLVPTKSALEADKRAMDKLMANKKTMWVATLNLDETSPPVKASLDTLGNIISEREGLEPMLRMLRNTIPMPASARREIDYLLGVMRASPRAYALSILTMWHEEPSRYPPIPGAYCYWLSNSYTRDKRLIQRLPVLLAHAGVLSSNVLKSTKAATRLAML